MARWLRRIFLTTCFGLIAWGCSDSDSDEPKALGALGDACNSDSGCAEGSCGDKGVCTLSCESHEDCGCAPGTTDSDIFDGLCDLGCYIGECRRECSMDSDVCEGSTECTATLSWSACM